MFEFIKNYDHLGRLLMDCLNRWPDTLCHIDASTGEKETNSSVLSRSTQLANCFRNYGLQPGDVLCFSGKNHLDVYIPYYAALFNGLPIVGVDPTFKYDEIKTLLKLTEPKMAFCDQEAYEDYVRAAADLRLQLRIVTFGAWEHSLKNFVEEFDSQNGREFEVASFDCNKIYAWLVCTSGTTGRPKLAAFTHDTCLKKIANMLYMGRSTKPEIRISLNLAPVQWISAYINAVLCQITNHTKVQTSAASTPEHVIDIINKYKPTMVLTSPALLSGILSIEHEKPCDFTCFDSISVTGCRVPAELLIELRKRARDDSVVMEIHGQTETIGSVLMPSPAAPLGSCGRLVPNSSIKLVNTDTGEEIHKPHERGELWCKGPRFTEYYMNPEETMKAITEDGWYKTGDIFYKDKNDYFYFVERVKMLIKYRNYHVIPVELEDVIRTHPSISDVCVTSVYDACDGEHPVACVVRKPGCELTAQEIKELVASKLSDSKQLRGGVVFLNQLPYTSTGKVARARLKSLVQEAHRE